MIEEGISPDVSEYLRESNQKFVKDSAVAATHLVLPTHANTTNITFGGQVYIFYKISFLFLLLKKFL